MRITRTCSHTRSLPPDRKSPCSPGGRATISLTNRLAGKLLLSLAGNPPMILDRRHLLRVGGAAAIAAATPSRAQTQALQHSNPRGTPPQSAGAALEGVTRPHDPHRHGSARTWTRYNNLDHAL